MYSQVSPPDNTGEVLLKLLLCLYDFSLNNPVAAAVLTTGPCSYLSSVWVRKSTNMM